MEELSNQLQRIHDDLAETTAMIVKASEERTAAYQRINAELDELLTQLRQQVYGNK